MRIGIFGGSFDPIHNDHYEICTKFKNSLNLDRVIVLPTHLSPFKSEFLSSPKMRKEMVEIAFSALDYVTVSDFEINSAQPSYTYKTIEWVKSQNQNAELFLLIGVDSLVNFLKWKNVEYILNNVTLTVMGRNGYNLNAEVEKFKKATNKPIFSFDFNGKISSTFVRELLKLGVMPNEYLNCKVIDYIKENNLYKGNEYYKYVANELKESRLIHTAGVIVLAEKYAKRMGEKVEKAKLAALLHDVAKYKKREDFLCVNIPQSAPESIVHQYIGAHIAKNTLNIQDENVINAIAYHSTGRPNMSTLEKIIFLADLLEEGRTYDEVVQLRLAVEKDFEKGFKLCIERLIQHVTNSGEQLFELTALANEYYNKH